MFRIHVHADTRATCARRRRGTRKRADVFVLERSERRGRRSETRCSARSAQLARELLCVAKRGKRRVPRRVFARRTVRVRRASPTGVCLISSFSVRTRQKHILRVQSAAEGLIASGGGGGDGGGATVSQPRARMMLEREGSPGPPATLRRKVADWLPTPKRARARARGLVNDERYGQQRTFFARRTTARRRSRFPPAV